MAKRKASRRARPASGAAPRVRRQAPARKARPPARKASAKKRPSSSRPARSKAVPRGAAPKAVQRAARPGGKVGAPKPRPVAKAAAPKARRAATPPRKAVAPKAVKPQVKPQVVARKVAAPRTAKAAAPKVSSPKAAAPSLAARARAAVADQAKPKRVLDLDRVRRRIEDDDVVSQTPPSSLGLDRTASAARSGRQELRERYDNHTETSPALTGGDVDADWESAYAVGDEAPGGDNPTPDQNVVDDIAVAVGVEYDDNEELEGAERIEERDRHRWEFDPASSDDFDER